MRDLKVSRKTSGISKRLFAVMLICALMMCGTTTAFASDAYTSETRNHGTIAITAENENDGVINMNQGDSIAITVSPYIHVQYQGCDNNAGCPDVCGDMEGGCFFKDYGCNCITTPTKRITIVDTTTSTDGIVSIGKVTPAKSINDKVTSNDLTKKSDGTFLIKAEAVGTTELTVSTKLRDWVYTTKTYTIVVGEKITYAEKPAKVTVDLSTAKNGYDNVKVTWTKVAGAAGYKVYYKKASAGKWSSVTVKNNTTYTTKDLADGVKYEFKVYPYITNNGKDYISSKCTSASIYTLKKISTPKVVKSGSKVKVSWTNINGESGYQISKSTKKTGTNIVSTYKTTTGKYKTITAKKGTKYYYKVRAYKNVKVGSKTYKVYGPWSAVKAYKR